MLYYNINEKNIPTNNFLENYNGQIKKILNGKKLLNWSEYMSFLLDEDKRFKYKLSNYKAKNKYVENNMKNNKEKKEDYKNSRLDNIIDNKYYWFRWIQNSCRFDSFTLILCLIYYKYLKQNINKTDEINKYIDFAENAIKLSNYEKNKGIWSFFQDNINKNYFNIGTNLNNYKIKDVIAQLFNIL